MNVNYDNISQLIYGVIAGFVENKLVDAGEKLSKEHIKIKLSLKKLSKIFSKCVPEANENFHLDGKSIYNTKIFNVFISVLPSSVASRRIDLYLKNCEKNDNEKDIEFTNDHLVYLDKTYEIMKKYHDQNSKEENEKVYEEDKALLKQLEDAKNYFHYSDTNIISYNFASKRTICTYFNQKDDWKTILGRWFNYGTNIALCGANDFAKKYFPTKENLISILTKGLSQAFADFLGLGVFKIIRAQYRIAASMMANDSNYYHVGETIGEEIAENTSWLPLVKRRK